VRVLVTGGSGFIGSQVLDPPLGGGVEPPTPQPRPPPPPATTPRGPDLVPSPYQGATTVDTVVGDLLDPGALSRAMEGCDAVIHLAAAADVGAVEEAPVEAERTNARGTLAVLEAALAAGVGRVVYGSTIWVYGESGEGAIEE